jgi:hypothetical protein
VFKASYTNHYRAGLIELIDALEFRSHNTMHRPMLDALELIKRYRVETTHATQYYAHGEHVPVAGVIPADLAELLHRADKRGRQRVQRTVYECGVFQTLRERLRCKEIWVVGAEKWRNPDEDLPADFEAKRAELYAALRKPTNADAFVDEIREEMRTELAALHAALLRLDWLDTKAGRKQGETYPLLEPALTRPIRWDLIGQQYDPMIKYATAIRLGTASTEAILRRFTRDVTHPAHAAMLELGRAQRTIFLARWLRDRDLQRETTAALNVVENDNGVNDYIHFGKSGELASNRREEQELSMLCLHILQSSLGLVNTLMLQDVLAEPEWADSLGDADRRGLIPLFTSNMTPYGDIQHDTSRRLALDDAAEQPAESSVPDAE